MSKVEEKAKKFLKKLVSHTTLYKNTIDELEVYEPDDVIWAYKEGYHQAEKDLELGWEDINTIIGLYNNLDDQMLCNPKRGCKEILKQFKERKEK